MPNDIDTNIYSLTFADYSREKSTTTVNTLSLADETAYNTAKTAFTNALDAVTNGTLQKDVSSLITPISALYPTQQGAAREVKIYVRMQDDVTGKVYGFSIPTFDVSTVTMQQNSDFIDMTIAPATTLKSAIEDFVSSPVGNAVTVVSMEYVGRNN